MWHVFLAHRVYEILIGTKSRRRSANIRCAEFVKFVRSDENAGHENAGRESDEPFLRRDPLLSYYCVYIETFSCRTDWSFIFMSCIFAACFFS